MKFEMWKDPTNLDKHFHLVIEYSDMIKINKYILRSMSQELSYFNRNNASIEEKLMGLQILVRAIEEGYETTS